jgi:predicted transcriptional regulator
MKSYLKYIKDTAAGRDVSLLKAFKEADIPTSTYYRTIKGETELRYDTAVKVFHAIEYIHAANEARKQSEELRKIGKPFSSRTVQAKFKSRSLSS